MKRQRNVQAAAKQAREDPARHLPLDVFGQILILWVQEGVQRARAAGGSLPPARRLPFVAASVSTLWRRAALSTHRIWTFVVLPLETSTDIALLMEMEYLKVMQERSGYQPLDIVLALQFGEAKQERQPILRFVGDYMVQGAWRISLQFDGGASDNANLVLALLRKETPFLECLDLCAYVEPDSAALAGNHLLPLAPRLKRLVLKNIPVDTLSTIPRPSITELSMEFDASTLPPVSALLTQFPSLRVLSIEGSSEQTQLPVASNLLEELELCFLPGELGQTMHFPKLRHLVLAGDRDCLEGCTPTFIRDACPELESLSLRGIHADPAAAAVVACLPKLTTLRFTGSVHHGAFYRALCGEKKRIGPPIAHLALDLDPELQDAHGASDLNELCRAIEKYVNRAVKGFGIDIGWSTRDDSFAEMGAPLRGRCAAAVRNGAKRARPLPCDATWGPFAERYAWMANHHEQADDEHVAESDE